MTPPCEQLKPPNKQQMILCFGVVLAHWSVTLMQPSRAYCLAQAINSTSPLRWGGLAASSVLNPSHFHRRTLCKKQRFAGSDIASMFQWFTIDVGSTCPSCLDHVGIIFQYFFDIDVGIDSHRFWTQHERFKRRQAGMWQFSWQSIFHLFIGPHVSAS